MKTPCFKFLLLIPALFAAGLAFGDAAPDAEIRTEEMHEASLCGQPPPEFRQIKVGASRREVEDLLFPDWTPGPVRANWNAGQFMTYYNPRFPDREIRVVFGWTVTEGKPRRRATGDDPVIREPEWRSSSLPTLVERPSDVPKMRERKALPTEDDLEPEEAFRRMARDYTIVKIEHRGDTLLDVIEQLAKRVSAQEYSFELIPPPEVEKYPPVHLNGAAISLEQLLRVIASINNLEIEVKEADPEARRFVVRFQPRSPARLGPE